MKPASCAGRPTGATRARTNSSHLLAREPNGRTPTTSLTISAGWRRMVIEKTASASRTSYATWHCAAPSNTVRWEHPGARIPCVRALGRCERRASRATTLTLQHGKASMPNSARRYLPDACRTGATGTGRYLGTSPRRWLRTRCHMGRRRGSTLACSRTEPGRRCSMPFEQRATG